MLEYSSNTFSQLRSQTEANLGPDAPGSCTPDKDMVVSATEVIGERFYYAGVIRAYGHKQSVSLDTSPSVVQIRVFLRHVPRTARWEAPRALGERIVEVWAAVASNTLRAGMRGDVQSDVEQ